MSLPQVHLLFNEVCSPLIRWLAVAGGYPFADTITIAIFNHSCDDEEYLLLVENV